jgi:hypothetical protein
MAIACVNRPPAPSPWNARNPMSWPMLPAVPDRPDPARNAASAIWNSRLRPYRSPVLPHCGVETVEACR